MTTDLGAGEVTINGQTERWDSIKLLDSGVLRLARLDMWTDDSTGLTCTADKTAQYHAPGTWTCITPDIAPTGTLIVTSEIYPPEVLATSITEHQAIAWAAKFLVSHYQADESHTNHIEDFFRAEPGHQLFPVDHPNRVDVPRFRWVTH